MRPLRLAPLVLFPALASALHAQYQESDVRELFSETRGPSRDLFGWTAIDLGDVDGDGVVDVAVAAPFTTSGFESSAGRIHVFSGATHQEIWQRSESRTSAVLGYSLERLDWNLDGVLDVIAGAPFAGPGRVWVFSGTNGAPLAELVGEGPGGFGASIAVGGDLDADGVTDLVVAAPQLDTAAGVDSGRLYVFRRGATSPFATLDGPAGAVELGLGLAWLGNVDGMPGDELVAGRRSPTSFFDGSADVLRWTGTGLGALYEVTGVGMGFALLGDRIDGGRDVDGDGRPDFLVGDLFANEVEVFSGVDGALLHRLVADGNDGFGTGHMIDDVDGDGLADLALGAWKSSVGGQSAGRVLVFSGATGARLRTITPLTVDANLGIDVRSTADVDGDGHRDLLVGVYGDGFGGPQPGRVVILSGHEPDRHNVVRPAQLPGDPVLADVGGDPDLGPVIGSPFEVFRLALDCSGTPTDGPWLLQVRPIGLPQPVAGPFGWRWSTGPVLLGCSGFQRREVVHCPPTGLALPAEPALIGLGFTAQGACGRRFSSALTQIIGG